VTLETTADGLLVTRVGGFVLFANARFAEMLDMDLEKLPGMRLEVLVRELAARLEDPAALGVGIGSLPDEGPADLGILRAKNGRVFQVGVQTLPRAAGGARRVFSVTEVTALVSATDTAREHAETLRVLLNAPHDGAVLIELDGTIVVLNQKSQDRFSQHVEQQGLEITSFVGTNVYDLLPPDVRDERRARNEQAIASGERVRYIDERNGVWTDVTVDPIRNEAGTIVRLAIFSRDVTERKQDEQALLRRSRELEALNDYLERTTKELEQSREELRDASEQMAILLEAETSRSRTDQLTGGLNHGAIREVLHEAIAAEVTFAIAMVDLDGMKAINDTYGHQTGDLVLLRTVEALDRRGAIVGRYGGDEFMVALLDADLEDVQAYKDDVEAALRASQVIDPETGAGVDVVASVGLSWFPRDATTLTALVEAADERMYTEKANRRSESGLSSSRMFADDRTARMAGELLHLLTQPVPLDERLRLLSHRLSIGGGFAAVSFDVFDGGSSEEAEVVGQNAFSRAPEELLEAWNEHQRNNDGHPITEMLETTRRPVIIDDIQTSQFVTDEQKTLLGAVGIKSGIVVPLYAGETRVGTMSAGRKELAAFSASDERYLDVIGGELARLIDLILKAQIFDRQTLRTAQVEQAA
jgi:diguanylate cyclase (GGDEF)-like protein/PAS domain S-box-containing protein